MMKHFSLKFLIVLACTFLTFAALAKDKTPKNSNSEKPQNLASGGHPLDNYKGHFEGSESDHLADSYHKRAIRADFDLSQKNPMMTATDSTTNAPVLILNFLKEDAKELDVKISALQDEVRKLNKDGTCFSDANRQTQICFYEDGFDLEVTAGDGSPVMSLSLTRFAVEKPVNTDAEIPQTFSLSAAVSRALKMNFDNRIEFEHVVQARQNSKAAHLNLLPHISISAIGQLFAPGPDTLVGAAGDLIPFLIPNRWLQAKHATLQSYAEVKALDLMRLDTAALVEGLFYTYAHDRDVKDLYKALLDKATTIRGEINLREQMGQFAVGSTDNIDSIINSLNQDYSLFDQVLGEDLASIAQALGFYTPTAVKDATLDSEPDRIEVAQQADSEAIKEEALGRSFELKQIDNLAAAAKTSKTQLYFNWLDPADDPTADLGFNLKANFAVANSQIAEIGLRRSQIQGLLESKTFIACTEFNQSLRSFTLAKDGVTINQRRLDQILSFVKVGNNVDLFHIVDIIQDNLTAGVKQANAISAYRTSRGKIDRLLLQGYYAHPDKPVTETEAKH